MYEKNGIRNPSMKLIGKIHSPKLGHPSTRLKVIVIGDEQCGKTSLLNAFVHHEFNSDRARIFSDEVMSIRFGGKHYEFVIWDLSGCEKYDGLRYEFYQDADFFLICYDISNRESFESVFENWVMEVAQEASQTPFIVVGCKQDTRNDCAQSMTVPKEEAERTALEWGAKEYVECSAKDGYNTLNLFLIIAQIISMDEKQTLKNFGIFQRKRHSNKELLTVAIGDGVTENLYRSRINSRRVSNFT